MPRPWYHPQVLTAFVALQDIADDMGPTDFLPATHTSTCHEALNSEEGDGRALDLLLDTWPVCCCCATPCCCARAEEVSLDTWSVPAVVVALHRPRHVAGLPWRARRRRRQPV